MTGLDPAVAAVRHAVRTAIADLDGQPVGVALSGGADSTALLAGTCFIRRRDPPGTVTALIVDQHWYAGSADAARRAAATATGLGAEVAVLAAPSPRTEAAARDARYAALDGAVGVYGLAAVLLGHTRDDQAESVLLGLARGSGTRSLAGMAPRRGPYRRPLLDIARVSTRQACLAEGLPVYDDPANDDPAFTRNRVRRDALPALSAALDRDVRVNLARTARLLRADADLLDELAAAAAAGCERDLGGSPGLDVAALAALPAALRCRVLRRWSRQVTGAAVTFAHLDRLDALVTRWRGQGPVSLPGDRCVARVSGSITVVPSTDRP